MTLEDYHIRWSYIEDDQCGHHVWWSYMMVAHDNPKHVLLLCLCLCLVVEVCVPVWATVCFVSTPVRAERMLWFCSWGSHEQYMLWSPARWHCGGAKNSRDPSALVNYSTEWKFWKCIWPHPCLDQDQVVRVQPELSYYPRGRHPPPQNPSTSGPAWACRPPIIFTWS